MGVLGRALFSRHGSITIDLVSSLETALCRELGVSYPVFSVGFGAAAGPELAASVSNAGGFGVLGGVGLEPAEIGRRIARTRELTDRPFGVNVILAELEDPSTPEEDRTLIEQIQTALAQRAAAVVFFWGDPLPFVADAHRSGAKVLV